MAERRVPEGRTVSRSFQKRGGYESSGPVTDHKVPTKLPGAGAKPKAPAGSTKPQAKSS